MRVTLIRQSEGHGVRHNGWQEQQASERAWRTDATQAESAIELSVALQPASTCMDRPSRAKL